MDIKEIALKVADSLRNKVDGVSHMQSNQGLVRFAEALIESYKAELLKEVGEPVYQVCKSDSISLSSAWIDVTEQTYNDAGLYPEYGRRILYTSDQVAAAILKATKPLEDQLAKAEQRVAEWQPIETAPKDGAQVLLCGLDYGKGPGTWITTGSYIDDEWIEEGQDTDDCGLKFLTHWMPLPKAPNGASS